MADTHTVRSIPIEVELSADPVKREITFYASVFGNRDSQGMRVVKGAFAKSIRERLPQGMVKFFRNHEINIGPMRHGEEDEHGLLCVGYCSKTRMGDETLEQSRDGSLTHCSFRAGIVRDRAHWVTETDPTTGEELETLNLTELIWREAGPVDLEPANPLAAIIATKSMGDDMYDVLLELPYILKSYALTRRDAITAEERRIVKSLMHLQEALDEQGDALKALLAPGDITSPPEATPSLATPANAEIVQPDLSALLASIQRRGQVHL